MIPNPENVFELLQNDIATKLMQTSPFNTIKNPDGSPFTVLTEDEGDIQFEYDAMIAQLGLAIVVHAPSGKIMNPDLGGPLFDLSFDVWVSEAPTFNREIGTRVRGMRAALVVMGTLHGFVPQTAQILVPIQQNGFDKQRERTYVNDEDKVGTLVISRICHFQVPLVGGEITPA